MRRVWGRWMMRVRGRGRAVRVSRGGGWTGLTHGLVPGVTAEGRGHEEV